MDPKAIIILVLAIFGHVAMSQCPSPCECDQTSISCKGCPNNYLTIFPNTTSLFVDRCDNIEYLLKLHSHAEAVQNASTVLRKIEITNSNVERITKDHVSADLNISVLILKNDSIDCIDTDLVANSLVFFDVSNNNLTVIQNRTFLTFNNLIYLDLSDNYLSDLNEGSFVGLDRLQHLDLSNNNLTEIQVGTFHCLSSMQRLNLSSNKLATLCEHCIGNLQYLQQLDLSYNQLTNLVPGTLQFLPNLSRLLLANNPQLKPDAQTFVGTGQQLQQVDASRTGLSQVPESLTHSVRYLTLAGNRISTVRCGDLDSYPLLHMLDFADNKITYIEEDALGRLEMLSQIYLNINSLTSVPNSLPNNLTYLSLDKNVINNLTEVDFPNLVELKVLILSNNLIQYISENVFAELIKLEVLDLSNNPIQLLTPTTFSGPRALKELRLASINVCLPEKDISFPVPSPEGLESLHLQFSKGLTSELLADTAALSAMNSLQYLDVRYTEIVTLRSDLLRYFPQLKIFKLDGNRLNCTGLNWLSDWMRDNPSDEHKRIICQYPKNTPVLSLPTIKKKSETKKAKYISKQKPKRGVLVSQSIDENIYNITSETPRFMYRKIDSEASGSKGSLWVILSIGSTALVASGAVILWRFVKGTRNNHSSLQEDLMEVQAISAVGELW